MTEGGRRALEWRDARPLGGAAVVSTLEWFVAASAESSWTPARVRIPAGKEIAMLGFLILEILERIFTNWAYFVFGTEL